MAHNVVSVDSCITFAATKAKCYHWVVGIRVNHRVTESSYMRKLLDIVADKGMTYIVPVLFLFLVVNYIEQVKADPVPGYLIIDQEQVGDFDTFLKEFKTWKRSQGEHGMASGSPGSHSYMRR